METSKRKRILVIGSTIYANPYLTIGDVNVMPHQYVQPTDVQWADIVLFTGGEDVSPEMYDEYPHEFTRSNWQRDMMEQDIFTWASEMGKHMAGICRGSQFLNVMAGGKMHQHVNKHGIHNTHPIYCAKTGEKLADVTSTHHQIAILPEDSELIAVGDEGIEEQEVEAWYNPTHGILGVQFHPEYMGVHTSGWKYYQQLIKEYLV